MLSSLFFRLVLLSGALLPWCAAAQQLPATAGTGLRGEYSAGKNFEKLAFTRADLTIDFNWTLRRDKAGRVVKRFVAPGPGLAGEQFSVRWTGHLYAPQTGLYTFQATVDDGMRVWVGGQQILSSWRNQPATTVTAQIRLEAGRYYPLRVEYYQVEYDTRALLAWQLPNSTAAPKPIPAHYLYQALPTSARPVPVAATRPDGGTIGISAEPPAGRVVSVPVSASSHTPVAPSAGRTVPGKVPAGIGLQATYSVGAGRGPAVHSRVEPVVQVTWPGASPAPGVPGQGFSVRWTGYVRAPESGLYVFHVELDDAADISFAGQDVLGMEKYEPEYFLPRKPPIPVDMVQRLEAGRFYRIDLAYKDVRGVSRAILSWTRPADMGNPATLEQAFAAAKSRGSVVVPQQFLYPELPPPLPELPAAPVVAARPAPTPPAIRRPAPRPTVVAAVRPKPTAPVRRPAPDTTLLLPDLAALSRGGSVTLPNLYFTQSTASLLPTSRPTLNALARRLREQPALRLEIAGHTDNVGDAALNLRLSEQRARVVRRYLMQQGIDSVRLAARGYGGARPVADNRDPQQRPRNRRVEVVVQ